MDLSNVGKLGALNGQALSVEEVAGLEVAMTQRKLDENITGKLQFWGKVFGNTQDYLVVSSVDGNAEFPDKKYFYCNPSDYLLRAVPPLSAEYEKTAQALTQRFTGDPSFFNFSGAEEDEAEDPDAPPVERFREIHRLAYAIKSIEHDCALTPRGAVVVDAGKKVVRNAYFTGLSYQSCCEARSYFHMRRPENPQAVSMMKKAGIVKSGDFLDPITKDKPTQMWTFGMSASGEVAHVRNMYWDGYSFYSVVDSTEFGGCYFGIGVPQYDIAFMF